VDHQRFDRLLRAAYRSLAAKRTRRGVLAALLVLVAPLGAEAGRKKKKKCKGGKKRCRKTCCLPNQGCRNGKCQCATKEDACGTVCCPSSQACINGACGCPEAACAVALDPTDDVNEACFCAEAVDGQFHCFADLFCGDPPQTCTATTECDAGEICNLVSCQNVSRCSPVCSLR
jgi:hypothetical protein